VKLATDKAAVDPSTVKQGRWARGNRGEVHWVKPNAVVEVAFSEWTPDGHVRHPTFRGIREDKPAKDISRERVVAPATSVSKPAAKPKTSIKVTNPERLIDPSTGLRKVDLVHYYESIAEWMLPHLQNRPVSLVRAPTGITGELFFQKHPETRMPLTELDPALWPGHDPLLAVNSPEALVSAAQMNVVELHTWNSVTKHINEPDRFILDLDPGEGVTWQHVKEAALLVRTLLDELELDSWLKTSGGKGLHVVVPLAPKLHYDVVKAFSQAFVQHMARTIPQRFVAKSGGSNRVGKIFIDYLRNGHAQTTAAAFSARARPGLGVSMPISWEQLPEVKRGDQWTIATAREYLSFQKDDPWAAYWKSRQMLTKAMKLLGVSTRSKASGTPLNS
jgi:bifunctional non-homologous end joining protein LigD